jgi:hypothetical protein
MSLQKILISGASAALIAASLAISAPAHSSDAGAFIGGVFASRVMHNMRRRTAAQEEMAASSAQPVQQAAPAPAKQTPQQKLDELDKLAAGGYITPEEYKAKKKAIINNM